MILCADQIPFQEAFRCALASYGLVADFEGLLLLLALPRFSTVISILIIRNINIAAAARKGDAAKLFAPLFIKVDREDGQ